MTVYHIVLFKLKKGTPESTISQLKEAATAMVGQVPGLQKIDLGPPIPATAARAKGFDYGLIAILDKAEDLKGYAEHPAHLKYALQY
ncbi:hypothetical protein PRZ48_003403 [Zasmidium cellare]|uniref:Stress-response A/B barrel domain-containing protein n=1 Tax=Zasmidium cellare TaxID=395010 RepID=A0ABR0EWI2_ZASCE|nr:hypothetical protein PRZ48_003403 [Zasmidium cellare]